ncbi:hypothetical protein EMN47_15770 [Prolixibacteraceae bacterium JC049]|nr:hypothetical protein [Prolixibacteraceae bacterium JC049]
MNRKLLSVGLIGILICSACSLSITIKNNMKVKRKTIDEKECLFVNNVSYKKVNGTLIVDNKVTFSGLGKRFEDKLPREYFKKKVDLDDVDEFHVDSVSFNVNGKKNKVDLIYYLKLDNKRHKATFKLIEDKRGWHFAGKDE